MKFKVDIQTLSSKIRHNNDRKSRRDMEELEDQLEKLYEDRKGLLRTFTGAVTANRLKKMKKLFQDYKTARDSLITILGPPTVERMIYFKASFDAIIKPHGT